LPADDAVVPGPAPLPVASGNGAAAANDATPSADVVLPGAHRHHAPSPST